MQRPLADQILTPEALFDYCKCNTEGIEFIYMSKVTLDAARIQMENRYTFGSIIPGTRSYHHFEPITESTIGYKRTSDDTEFAGVHNFSGIPSSNINFKLYDYVAYEYDSFWWIGVIEEITDGNLEVKVKFIFSTWTKPFL